MFGRMLALAVAAIIAALTIASVPAHAQKKYAFVVGIDRYDNLPPNAQLQKAVGDAKAMSEALAALGFAVTAEPNAGRSTFNDRWQLFLDAIKPGDMAAVFFSGHGVEIGGANYLLPRDVPRIRVGRDELLKRESLSLAEILADLRERRPGFSFIVIDACRDNPFAEGGKAVGAAKGLARVDPPEGTFIMFSAGAYQTALDRLSDTDKAPTSVYTRTLLPLMRAPGLSLLEMADRVGEQVRDLAATVSHRQTPAFYSGVVGGRRVCLAGCDALQQPTTPAAPSSPLPNSAADVVRVCREVEQVTSLSTLAVLERQHRGTPIADCISARIGELKAAQTASAKAADEQQRLAMIEQQKQETARKAAEAEAVKKRAEAANTMQPGRVFRDCADCPEMVVVPAGEFMMGSMPAEIAALTKEFPNDKEWWNAEAPQRRVTIAKPFAVGKFEVTFAEWDACVAAGGCKHRPGDESWGRGKQPVINVSWDDITKEYLLWLSRKTGKTYRLLTEAEWEYAARGAKGGLKYWWGNDASHEYANYGTDTCCNGLKQGRDQWEYTAPVGQFPANHFGLHDMHGNVWEWVEDCYHKTYQGAPVDGSAWTTGACEKTSDNASSLRVLRGGSWVSDPQDLRSAGRSRNQPSDRVNIVGFRIARTL